jgi:carboxyl-terminal processing protease
VKIPVSGRTLLASLALLIGACGGGSSSPAPTPTPTPAGIPYTAGVFQPAASFAAQCQVPRTGNDPDGMAYPDRQGSIAAENHFLRSWTNDLYLWYSEVPDTNPSSTATTAAYFDTQKTPVVLPSGQNKDKFHFTYSSREWYDLTHGTSVDFGINWIAVSTRPPRKFQVSFVEPGSPAANAGITRGAELQTVDGVDFVNDNTNTGLNTINNGLFPTAIGQAHNFILKVRGTGATQGYSLTSASITINSIPIAPRIIPTVTGNVGYLLFTTHAVNSAEQDLITAINTLKTANVTDLVLDLRYNGGGYLDLASELAYMIAGPNNVGGKTFELIQFNSKHPATNPIRNTPIAPVPFYSTTQGFSVTQGQALPTLNLSKLYVLTTKDTCSASESVMNSLRGAGVTVYQIGGDTCGKPYGFYPQDNCGTTYFSIQFRGVNAVGFGDYAEGFTVNRANAVPLAKLPGCTATDDLTRDLGDLNEEQLHVATVFRETGACTGTAPLAADRVHAASSAVGESGTAIVPPSHPWRDNRILR